MKNTTIAAFAVLLLFTASCKKEDLAPETTQINSGPSNPIHNQPTPLASVRLGFVQSYALLAYNSIVNTGYSQVFGNLGLASTGDILGFAKGSIYGNQEINNEESANAIADLAKVYENVMSRETADMVTLPEDLSGITLTPGLYISNDVNLKGELILDAKGDENAVFIIKVSRNAIIGDNVKITLKNYANANNVFWNVRGSLITGSAVDIKGNMIVLNSISVGENSFVEGRLLSLGGNIEINQSTISLPAVQ